MINDNNLYIYQKLTINLTTLNNVLVEKFIAPSIIDERYIIWHKRGVIHSYNGFPAYIEKRLAGNYYIVQWFKNGKIMKHVSLSNKPKTEIISEKIAARNFEGRAKKK